MSAISKDEVARVAALAVGLDAISPGLGREEGDDEAEVEAEGVAKEEGVLGVVGDDQRARAQAAGMGAETADGAVISAAQGGLRGIISICGCGAHLSSAVRR